MVINSVRAYALTVLFEDIYGSLDRVPSYVSRPASHFQRFRRRGQQSTIVEITTSDGLVGVGEAFGIPLASVTTDLVNRIIEPELMGVNPNDSEVVWDEFFHYFRALGHARGPLMEALSAVDIAMWDLKGKAAGRPVCSLLGATVNSVRAYASPVPFFDDAADSAARALAYVRDGFDAVKLKIGRGLATDREHIATVRSALPDDTLLMLDVNGAYDVETACELARSLDPSAIAWLEEPVAPDDLHGLVRVKEVSSVPIAWGENEFQATGFEIFISAGAVDVAQPNITRAGGITGCTRIAALCADRGVLFAPHGVGSAVGVTAALHVCAATPAFHYYEANRLDNPLRDELAPGALRFSAGAFHLNEQPGLGIELDRHLLDRYRSVQIHG